MPAPLVNDRAALALAMRNMKKRGIINKSTVVTPSFLRVAETLQNNKSQYRFQIEERSGEAADEQKLGINDSFFCTHIGFYIVPVDTATNLSNPYETYPNAVAFVATGTPGDLEVIYKGKFSVKVQSTVMYDDIDLQRFRDVPQTQQVGAADKSQHNPLQGLMQLTPNLFLNGRASNDITATFPTDGGVAWAGTGTVENKIVWVAYGFLAKNVSFNKEA